MAWIKGQLVTADQLNAAFALTFPAGSVSSYSATLLTGMTQGSWFTALGLPAPAPGSPNGLAILDSSGLIALANLPASLVGALSPKGGWNAATNNPALASGTGTKGFFYVVTTAGATVLDGNNTWSIGDCVFFDGTVWRKINGSGNISIPSTNISDSTATGRALLTSVSVSAQRALLNIDQVQPVVDTNSPTITNAMEAVVWTALTGPRTGALAAASTFNPGQMLFICDESGNCSPANTITITTPDSINGASSYVLKAPSAGVALIRVSVSKWTALPFAPSVAPWITQPVSVRQTVLAGPVDANGFPAFLPASSAALSITSQNISAAAPFIATSASGGGIVGQSDITGVAASNITWPGLIANSTNYLGVVVTASGTLTPFSTTIAPVYQQGGTPSVVSGAITFLIGSMTCYQGNGSTAPQINAVMIAQAVTGAGTVTSVSQYAYNGIYDGPYTATLPSAGLTAITHNLGVIPNTCEMFFQNITAEANYNPGDVFLGRSGMSVNVFESWSVSLTPTAINLTAVANWSSLNKTTAAGFAMTAAKWSWRMRATRGW
jgi:hypothetical protein